MALIDIVTTVQGLLAAGGWCPGDVQLGPTDRASRQSPPFVFWMPTDDRYTGPDAAVSRAAMTASTARALHTRWIGAEAHCWAGGGAAGDDYSATEQLVHAVIACIRRAPIYGGYNILGGHWVAQEKSGVMQLGNMYVLRLEFAEAVTDVSAQGSVKVLADTLQREVQLGTGSVVVNP